MASTSTSKLSSLLSASSITDHEEILRTADGVLKTSKNNQDALHTRVVALLKLDRFDDALQVIDEGDHNLNQRCVLEKAYALYKTGKLEEAAKVVKDADISGSRGLKHVTAQLAYRAEKFEDTARIYKELSVQEFVIDGEWNDLRINSSATDAQLEWQGNGDKVDPARKKPRKDDLEAFEIAYNSACACIARGDLGPGSVLLGRAKALCETLDELTDEEKKAEVLPIIIQQAYVFIRMGKHDKSRDLLEIINIADVPEASTRVVAQNNVIAAMEHHPNPYLTQRLFYSVPILQGNERLFEHQSRILRRNRYAVDLQAHKYDGVARSTAKCLLQAPSPTILPDINNLSPLNAACYTHRQSSRQSLRQLSPLLERRPTDIGLILTIIQLHVLASNSGAAIDTLEALFKRLEASTTAADQDIRFAPGLTALLVSLYRLENRHQAIKKALRSSASYWREKSKPSEDLLVTAGVSLLDSCESEELKPAMEIFSSLRMLYPNNRIALAGFIAASATSNFPAAQADIEKLSPVDRLISGIDAAALEDGGIASIPIATTSTSRKRSAPIEKEKPIRNKRIRKSKMPSDFEEGKIMDPERWLPMRDRSNYRPKGKKGKKKAQDTTQGGIVKEEESLELVGGAGAVKVEKASGGGGGSGRAKKKKR